MQTRTEHDSMGEVQVPADKYWGAQTERSRRNFRIGQQMPKELVYALANVKKAAAKANAQLGALDAQLGLETAAIGGKDSMSGTFENLDVPPLS